MSNTSPTATLYTELPYPADGVTRTTNGRLILAGVKQHAPHLLTGKRLRIVDVGCGTGEHTVGLARFFPQAEIFGSDINPASLDLARNLARREGTSVQFVDCDITRNLAERLDEASPGPFDIVCTAGVLHHLADPQIGFSAVRQVIAPGGLFYCYMYTHFGRREEMAIKSLLDEIFPGPVSWETRAGALAQLRFENVHTRVEWNPAHPPPAQNRTAVSTAGVGAHAHAPQPLGSRVGHLFQSLRTSVPLWRTQIVAERNRLGLRGTGQVRRTADHARGAHPAARRVGAAAADARRGDVRLLRVLLFGDRILLLLSSASLRRIRPRHSGSTWSEPCSRIR